MCDNLVDLIRSRKVLHDEYLLAKIGADTEENEQSKVDDLAEKSEPIQPKTSNILPKICQNLSCGKDEVVNVWRLDGPPPVGEHGPDGRAVAPRLLGCGVAARHRWWPHVFGHCLHDITAFQIRYRLFFFLFLED